MAAVVPPWVATAAHDAPWHELTVCVAGVGVSGAAAARVLATLGASVVAVDAGDGPRQQQAAAELTAVGVDVRLGDGDTLPDGTQLVVTSPGWRRESALFRGGRQPRRRGVGRARTCVAAAHAGAPPWLIVTGTDGKTTTTMMLASMLRAAGQRTAVAGNIGTPLVEWRMRPLDVLAVEFGSFQLHWSPSVVPRPPPCSTSRPTISIGGATRSTTTWRRKGSPSRIVDTCAVGNADDAISTRLLARAPGRRVSFTLQSPRPQQLGVVDDLLIDRAFVDDAENTAVELAALADMTVPGTHNVANALAAAALARAFSAAPAAIAEGLRTFTPAPHRIAEVAVIDGVRFVDDSKATSPHAAAASLHSFDSIVWIAGGLGKGIAFDDVVRGAAPRLRAAVVIGACRHELADALARHAPDVRVVEVVGSETDQVETVMDRVVAQAFALASPGDTVLLAPPRRPWTCSSTTRIAATCSLPPLPATAIS